MPSEPSPQQPTPHDPNLQLPPIRPLRIYAFDPSLDLQIGAATMNQVTARIRWEADLKPGPVGEYLEVIDIDPASSAAYEPVDLNDTLVLAQNGLPPSEGNPKFHQQMVYAVGMLTIQNFEQALGRKALWSTRLLWSEERQVWINEFVRRLRIFPHAIREANAFYDPDRKALLFGYFPASVSNPGNNLPGGMVFSCLSFDIVSHETTHALLDGLNRRYVDNTNLDALAFHEAFADIVALLQRFKYPEVLRHEIAATRGKLRQENLLSKLAWQVGQAIGHYGALRDALGTLDADGNWVPAKPDPRAMEYTTEPHARGAILVAAIFDAFVTIYEQRTNDLIRLYTGGTGVLEEGAIHPDLVNRLAEDAALVAGQVLNICVRALDYCPPVDLTFGEYLRAMITLDSDMVADDQLGYRIAFIESFRRRGIYPHNVRTLAVDSLRWRGTRMTDEQCQLVQKYLSFLEDLWLRRGTDLFEQIDHLTAKGKGPFFITPQEREILNKPKSAILTTDREFISTVSTIAKRYVHRQLSDIIDADSSGEIARHLGLLPGRRIEVSQARPTRRVLLDGSVKTEMLLTLLQRVEIDWKTGEVLKERSRNAIRKNVGEAMVFRGGSTLVIDMDERALKYIIRKRIDSQARQDFQRSYQRDAEGSMGLRATYSLENGDQKRNPFAALHREAL